ncbi:MAG: hypothetical protein IJ005_09105 [Bacteroidales bacterium]|nr:hypothetical protein [Bacteroidales bacterium]
MMKILCRHIFFSLFFLIMPALLGAQDLPVLPVDPAVSTATLPNGTSCYVVTNTNLKGLADFALVQRTGVSNIPDTCAYRSVRLAKDALSSLPRCLAPSLQSYVTSHGVTPGRDGFVKVSDDATVFRFENVMLSEPAVLDSTLLVLLDVIDRISRTDDGFIRRWYAPSDHAIIVAGDVDASEVIEKLRLMSLMTPAYASSPRLEYEWKSCDSAVVVHERDSLRNMSRISLTWRSARTSREYMNTVQPAIYEMFLAELGMIARERLHSALYEEDIPYADISHSHVMSAQYNGDESFTVSVSVAPEYFERATATVADVFAAIDGGDVSVSEIARVKRICVDAVHERSIEPVMSNTVYVDKCVASFLYNGSLASLRSKVDFLSSRQVSDSTELRLFNNIASALLDPERNIIMRYVSDAHEPDSVGMIFRRAWNAVGDTSVHEKRQYSSDYIPRFEYAGSKIKIRSVRTDPMSGGRVWVFSNGFKVVYRYMDTGGRMHWCLAQNGGYGSIPDICAGEGGYVADYLFLSRIGDVPAGAFLNMLNGEGISMSAEVGLSETILKGYAPKDRMELLMRALIAVVNDRSPDEDAAGYHEECAALMPEFIKGTAQQRKNCIDSIMCPDYRYTAIRSLRSIAPGLAQKADRFFDSQSEKMNDGILLLVGDMNEDALKKLLLEYVGGFKTTDKAFRRPKIRYQPPSGCSTYTVKGGQNTVDIAMSMPMPLTADNFMAAEIAVMVLEKRLSEAVTGTGMYLEVQHDCNIYPQERFNVRLSFGEAPADGFASDVESSGPIEALSVIRSTLDSIGQAVISDSEMATMKSQLKGGMAIAMTTPSYWIGAISQRYISGKDFTTAYEERINAVTADKVRTMLSALNDGSKVEYIISK